MNIFQISSADNFLLSLYEGINARYSKEQLSELNIFLPNKNACYKLTRIFYDNIEEDKGILIPKILPLGEISETSLPASRAQKIPAHLPRPISFEEQTITITQLIKRKLEEHNYSANDVIQTAEQITKLIAKFRIDDIHLSNIHKILNVDYAKHLTLYCEIFDFITKIWPHHIQKNNVTDNIEYRNLFIQEVVGKNLLNRENTIIAGSTGSIKSTRKLIKSLLEGNGCFIPCLLEGYKTQDHWFNIDEHHPNFCIKELFEYLDYKEDLIPYWHQQPEKNSSILSYFINKAQISLWEKESKRNKGNKQIELIETNIIYEEAFAIALRCQSILKNDSHKKILIMSGNSILTNNLEKSLNILRLGYSNLRGKQLSESDEYVFIENLAKFYNEPFSIKSLLSLLKNNFLSLGYPREQIVKMVAELEISYLRKICTYECLEALIDSIDENHLQIFLKKFTDATQNLKNKFIYLEDYCRALLSSIQKITSLNATQNFFLSSEIGQKIISSIYEAQSFLKAKTKYPTNYIRLILFNSIKNKKIFNHSDENNSIIISTPIDSRLDDADYIILSDFNNNSWPINDTSDPWLNENIYSSLGLSHEILKNSLASYDVATLLSKDNIIISRSHITDGNPTLPSKWLERIKLYELKTNVKILERNEIICQQLNNLHRTLEVSPLQQEEISPPSEIRPKELAVTQIEKLMRDPYSIYALKILKLKKIHDIDRDANQADFGNFIHATIDKFNKLKQKQPDFLNGLISLGEKEIKKFGNKPLIKKIWWPRFMEIATWYEKFEKLRNNKKIKVLSEIEGHILFNTSYGPFKLKAKADQIEINGDQITILDFKTGILPSQIDIISGFSPQMTLEALIASEEGFGIKQSDIKAKYIQFSSGKNFGKVQDIINIDELILSTKEGAVDLIELYSSDKQPYLICPNPSKYPKYNDYKHLERVE